MEAVMRRKFGWLAAAAGVMAMGWSGAASAAVIMLDFARAGCNGDNCSYGTILPSYGDDRGVDVSYRTANASDGTTYGNSLRVWGDGYGDLSDVVFGGTNATQHGAEITFTALAGYELRLISFDFAAYQRIASSTPIAIATLGGTSVLAGRYGIGATGHEHLDVNSDWVTDGIRLAWGPDAFNVGLDNIAFEVRPLASAVPEPATWAMMILGVGGIGAAARRRRSAMNLAMAQAG
jgi:hypothetical protein